ncbi:MAG TPA: TadE family protein, partial [Anaerolineales bacterium]|nr:TadE family protein [Anaerolineales bacterium]
MRNNLHLRTKEAGQSMVELALTITLLMMLLAGTIDLGRAFFTWLAMRDAAQEGASYGTFHPSDLNGIRNRVWDNLGGVISNPTVNVDVDPVPSSTCEG